MIPAARPAEDSESLLSHRLKEHFAALLNFHSESALRGSVLYQSIQSEIFALMGGKEYGHYAASAPAKPFYRAVAWNIERGMHFDAILEVLKGHPEISTADFLLLTETDIGMARTSNKNVARDLARELKMNYFFGPAYLNLAKGNAIENHIEGENELALHGNALLSRYPIRNLKTVPLKNCKDKMKGRDKRIGCQTALVADIELPEQTVTAVVAHLDAHSSQRQRASQMRAILNSLQNNPHPVLIGGDLNTSSYNARHAAFAFFGFWNKVFRGVDSVIENHHPYPDRYYDRFLFDVFKNYGYEYKTLNELGVGTLHYEIEDLRTNQLVEEVVPDWCRKIMEDTLRRHGGKVSLKLDWFAGKGIVPAQGTGSLRPKVIPSLKKGGVRLSDHDPILLDFNCVPAA